MSLSPSIETNSCEDIFPSITNFNKMNITESVKVPTSDHVAEIVGRQGAKIKDLRTRTGTYIKTPVKDEEPVFIITGRREGIEVAKREILSISETFTHMRSTRLYGNCVPEAGVSECIKIEVAVPYDVVGLVVGPKGATIKRIQKDTQTYIVTPSRDQKPIFQISGLQDNVLKAKKEIKEYVRKRTGKSLNDFNWNLNNKSSSSFSSPSSLSPVLHSNAFTSHPIPVREEFSDESSPRSSEEASLTDQELLHKLLNYKYLLSFQTEVFQSNLISSSINQNINNNNSNQSFTSIPNNKTVPSLTSNLSQSNNNSHNNSYEYHMDRCVLCCCLDNLVTNQFQDASVCSTCLAQITS